MAINIIAENIFKKNLNYIRTKRKKSYNCSLKFLMTKKIIFFCYYAIITMILS